MSTKLEPPPLPPGAKFMEPKKLEPPNLGLEEKEIQEAIGKDRHIIRTLARIERYRKEEELRIAKLKEDIKGRWEKLRLLQDEKSKLVKAISALRKETHRMQRQTRFRAWFQKRLEARLSIRKRNIRMRFEEKWLSRQRIIFRHEIGVIR